MSSLVKVIQILHVLFIAYMLTMPFIAWNRRQRVIYFWVSLSVLLHWMAGNTTCALTLIEDKLLGIPHEKSFIYKLISPVYDLSNTISDEHVRMVVTLVTIVLWSLNLSLLAGSIHHYDTKSVAKVFLGLQ